MYDIKEKHLFKKKIFSILEREREKKYWIPDLYIFYFIFKINPDYNRYLIDKLINLDKFKYLKFP